MALFEDTFPPYVPFGSRTLSGGEHGTDVAVLQTIYNQSIAQMNPPLGPLGQPIPVTGVYDAATRQAVRNVQSFYGISVDGVAGTNTYFLFGQGNGPNVTYGGPAYGSRELSQGDTGGDVTVLQNRLNLFRYASIIGAPADGIFGAKTASAVLQFKMDAIANGQTGLTNNSVAGSGTFDASWIYTYAGGRGIFTGRNGFDVVFIQVLLKKLGYYSGAVTGYYDAATQAAVTAFQTTSGIIADGVVGQQTYYRLGLLNAVVPPSPYPVPPIGTPPPPGQTECCFTLSPTSAAIGVNRGVFFVHNGPSPAVQWMLCTLLPPASTYGSYSNYAYSMNSPSSFVLMSQCMTLPSGTQMWCAAVVSTTGPTLPEVTIRVAPSNSTGSSIGPVILSATGGCPLSSDAPDSGCGHPGDHHPGGHPGHGGGCDDAGPDADGPAPDAPGAPDA